jgi:hypothetical protein
MIHGRRRRGGEAGPEDDPASRLMVRFNLISIGSNLLTWCFAEDWESTVVVRVSADIYLLTRLKEVNLFCGASFNLFGLYVRS